MFLPINFQSYIFLFPFGCFRKTLFCDCAHDIEITIASVKSAKTGIPPLYGRTTGTQHQKGQFLQT